MLKMKTNLKNYNKLLKAKEEEIFEEADTINELRGMMSELRKKYGND